MDIKGSGVIHPPCPSSIIENILMEIDQLNINNNHFEELDINLHISNNVKGHRWRPSEKNINHHLIEREDSINIHLVHGIVMNINKIREDINKIPGMDGISILDSISHRTQTWHLNDPSEQDENGTATSYRGNNISDHLRVHPRHLELQHHLGQDSKMEDIVPGSISISFIWRHPGMLLLGHLQQPK